MAPFHCQHPVSPCVATIVHGTFIFCTVALVWTWGYSYREAQNNVNRDSGCEECHCCQRKWLFSTRTAYDEVRGKHFEHDSEEDRKRDCEPLLVYMVMRHGIRYPGADEIQAMNSLLPNLQERILNSVKKVALNSEALDSLRKWIPSMSSDIGLEMADTGLSDMYNIGYRLASKYPQLFNMSRPALMSGVDMRHTDNPRSELSAAHVIKGVLQQDKAEELSEKYVEDFTALPVPNDTMLLYCDTCKKYVMQRINSTDPERVEASLFDNSSSTKDLIHRLNRRLGLSTNSIDQKAASVMYEACRYEYAISEKLTWCRTLGPAMLNLFEYRHDMKYYWRYGYGRYINYAPSCLLLKNILTYLRASAKDTSNYKAVFRVGHSRTILPLLTRLGLYQDTLPLMANNKHEHRKRKWRLSLINPFSSNLAIVLLKCNSNFFVKIYVNENEVKLPGCRMLCPLSDVITKWRSLLKGCDFDALCDDDLDLSLINWDIHRV